MDYKLDYITRVLEKTKEKRTENYIIGRIWHSLNDDEVKLVPQQYVSRSSEKYALTDIYFPQINLHVEVNEPAHYVTQGNIDADALRKIEIIEKTNHTLIAIDCRGDLKSMHKQVDEVVTYIKKEVDVKRNLGTFEPWNPEFENSPEYHIQKGYLDCSENVQLNTIEDICKLFNARFVKRGYLRPGAADHPTDNTMTLWWPTKKRQTWENELHEDRIIEKNIDSVRQEKHVFSILGTTRTKRVVFYKHKDELGFTSYKFKGVYELDRENTATDKGVAWKKIADKCSLLN